MKLHISILVISLSSLFLSSVSQTDPMTALVTEIDLLDAETQLAAKAATDAQAADAGNADSYKVCAEMFVDSQEDLRAAKEAVTANDVGTTNIKISAAMSYFETCDDTFAESGLDNPLAQTTAKLKKLASSCLALTQVY